MVQRANVLSVTYRPAVYHNEGLCFWIEVAFLDGFRHTGHNVTHVIVWGFCSAQGELGHDVIVVAEPFGGIQEWSGGDCFVCCYNTHTETTGVRLLWPNENAGDRWQVGQSHAL